MSVKRIDSSLTAAVADRPSVRSDSQPRSSTARGRKGGWTEGWIDGGQGAVDARAVAVGRYFRTVRSATKDGQAAEEREGVTLTDGRTGESCRPGRVKGGREDSERRSPPRHAATAAASLSLSPSPFFLPFAVTAAVDLAVWLAAAERQQQQGERASERERKGGGGGRGGDSGGEGNQDSRRDERASGRSSGRSKSLLT